MFSDNLFGEDFPLESPEDTSRLLKKARQPKKARVSKAPDPTLALHDKLLAIEAEVNRILGRYRENTLVITDRGGYDRYIDQCIANGICAVDTETNNSTEPITCKLMGLCLYTPNQKQVYIPCNHVDLNTGKRLESQLSEEEIASGLRRLVECKVRLVYHNATFDMRVLQCKCGVELPCDWDTRVAARILNENESTRDKSGLKYQYKLHIDPNCDKYDIESLFQGLDYAIIPIDLFALYAATDSYKTYRLYEWQLLQFRLGENSKMKALLDNVEIPEVPVVKDMELAGITIDQPYWERLKKKYDSMLEDVDRRVAEELRLLEPKIHAWRLSSDANRKSRKPNGKGGFTEVKSKNEQLEDPVNLSSPTQFAILLYDILGVPVVDKSKPRGTGEDIVNEIYKQTGLNLCKLLIERRGYIKILSAYIDNIPPLLDIWKDGKIRCGFDQNGTDTGRFTSGGSVRFLRDGKKVEIPCVNLQTIPSHNKEIRMLYKASEEYHDISMEGSCYTIGLCDDVQVVDGTWKKAGELTVGDTLATGDGSPCTVGRLERDGNSLRIYTMEDGCNNG